MLVLSRYRNEKLILRDKEGNFIASITVVEIRKGDINRPRSKVKLGIEAGPDVVIDREEVDARKQVETE